MLLIALIRKCVRGGARTELLVKTRWIWTNEQGRQEGNMRAKPALQLSGFAVTARIFIAALHRTTGLLTDFLDEKRCLTLGTGLIKRSIPERKFTLRIAAARIKVPSFFRALLYQIPAACRLRAFHPQGNGLGRFTFGIRRTGQKLSEATGFDHHGT